MKKVLLAVLFITLGMVFTSNAYAQGLKVKVSNNNELVKALENPDVTSIVITQDGFYEAIDNNAFFGNVIYKDNGTKGPLDDCSRGITTTNNCWVDDAAVQTATAFMEGTTCPNIITPIGWTTTSSSLHFTSDITLEDATFTVDGAGQYQITYTWNSTNTATGNVYIFDTPEVNITNLGTPSCESTSFDWEYDFDYIGEGTTVTMTISDGTNSIDVTPAGDFTDGRTGNISFTPASPLALCGDYTLNVTTNNLTDCGTNNNYDFFLYDAPEGVNAGPDQPEVCYDGGYATSVTGVFGNNVNNDNYAVSCNNGTTPTVSWTRTGGSGAGNITFGTATDNTTTVSSDACGEYILTYTVTNGVTGGCVEYDDVTVIFKALPTAVNAGEEQDVCEDPTNGYVTDLDGSFTEALCDGSSSVMWTQIGGVTATITNETTLTPHIEAPQCGTYEFQMDVTNGTACSVSSTVIVNFYDLATNLLIEPLNQEVCETTAGQNDYSTSVTGSYDASSCFDNLNTSLWTVTASPANSNPNLLTPTALTTEFTTDMCGTYELTFAVASGDEVTGCSTVSTTTINFYDLPESVNAGTNKDVCGFTTTLNGTYNALSCGTEAVQWSKYSGPGDPTFTPGAETSTSKDVSVTVDECGEYVFEFDVTNEDLCTVSSTITVFFTDVPEFTEQTSYPIPTDVCGPTSQEFFLGYDISCEGSSVTAEWLPTTGAAISAGVIADNMWTAELTTGDCGTYEFKYKVTNGDCEAIKTISITFYDTPDLSISGEADPYTCSEETYMVTNDACEIKDVNGDVIQVTNYLWTVTGGTLVSNTGESVTVNWNDINGTGSIGVTGTIEGPAECIGEVDFPVDKILPTLEGQVKYWNEFETYMPSPFPTDLYGTFPQDYFYVTLYLYESETSMIELETKYVQPRLMEDLNELMSYFDFDINTAEYGCEAQYLIKVWDGGLVYHNNPNPPANSPTYLGASYTYNNWGGVNATDAYAIQLMATLPDNPEVNASYPWIGLSTDNPAYGYYSNDIADVNNSSTITALDALIVNYRAVGLLGSFPDAGGNQFSPNFTVTGRMVSDLPEITFDPLADSYFDVLHVADVPFTHSEEDYMYFDDAVDHKYTSEVIPLGAKANYINLYYEAEGDVNASYIPTSVGFKTQPNMELIYENLVGTRIDDVITIPVSVDNDAEVNAISLFLNYRNDLIEVIGTNYAEENVFTNQEEGILNIGWFSTDTKTVEEGEIIAQIQVRVLAEIPEGTELFELTANTELADVDATPISDINLKTIGVTTDMVPFTGAELVASNYPNPFAGTTTITYTLPESGKVKVTVLNSMGMVVKTLLEEVKEAGVHNFVYNTNVEAGVYFYSITLQGENNTYSTVERMIVAY